MARPVVACLLGLGWVATPTTASAQIPVGLAWDRAYDGVTVGHQVLVGVRPNAPLVTLDVGGATSVVLPLPPGGAYYVAVRGYTALGLLGPATPETVVDLANTPGVPGGLRATTAGALVTLQWTPPVSGGIATNYLLSVGSAPGASNILSEVPLGNVGSISGPVPPGVYYARVQAGNLVGVGAPTADVQFQVGGGGAPSAPTGLGASWSGRRVLLRWSPPSDGSATSFVIEAGTASGVTNIGAIQVGAATTFTADVPPGVYYVRVRSVNAAGVSAPSNEIKLQ